MRKITQKELGQKLGISQRAVSMALQGDRRISEQTVKRVWEYAQAHGYRPNMAARTVKSGRFNNITVVLSAVESRSRFTIPFLNALLVELNLHGLHLSIARVDDAELTSPVALPRLLHQQAADGLIINYLEDIPESLKTLVQNSSQPVVWVGAKVAHDCVYPDCRAESRLAVEHLVALGHRRIAYFVPKTALEEKRIHFSTLERAQEYEAMMTKLGLPVNVWSRTTAYPSDLESALALFQRDSRPTAVICAWQVHLPALLYAAGLSGLRIPQDLSVLVYCDPYLNGPLPMTRLEMDFKKRAQAAVSILVDRIEGRTTEPVAPVSIPPVFVQGDSTAAL